MYIRRQCKSTYTKSDDCQLILDNLPKQTIILNVDCMTNRVEVQLTGKLRFSHRSQWIEVQCFDPCRGQTKLLQNSPSGATNWRRKYSESKTWMQFSLQINQVPGSFLNQVGLVIGSAKYPKCLRYSSAWTLEMKLNGFRMNRGLSQASISCNSQAVFGEGLAKARLPLCPLGYDAGVDDHLVDGHCPEHTLP